MGLDGYKILMQGAGAILILVSGSFMLELTGIVFLVWAGFINKKKVLVRRIGRTNG